MKIKTLKEVKYDVKTKLIRIRKKTGGLWLINGELYDVDTLHEIFGDDVNFGQDPQHTYQNDLLANAGDLLKIAQTSKGWAIIKMWNEDGSEYEDLLISHVPRFKKDPYGFIPHNQFDIGLDRFFDEENQRIIEVEFPKIRQRIVKRLPNQHNFIGKPSVLRNPKVTHKGSGAFASTYQHQDHPEDVRKITKPQVDIDGYHKYIELLKDNPDFDNPYFPKIREVTRYSKKQADSESATEPKQMCRNSVADEPDAVVLSVKKEALRHLNELTYVEVVSIFTRWFGQDWFSHLRKIRDVTLETVKSWKKYDSILVSMIRNIANDPEKWRGALLDDDLYNALYWLKYTVAQKPITFDLGGNNIMYKRSPYGIQLVLTDPVS